MKENLLPVLPKLEESIFSFDGKELIAFTDNQGLDWFRATEVCEILAIGNSYTAVLRYAQEYSREWKIGNGRPALYISEPGLYALIFVSKTDQAKKFQKWVFENVLPKLRRDRVLILQDATQKQIDDAIAVYRDKLDQYESTSLVNVVRAYFISKEFFEEYKAGRNRSVNYQKAVSGMARIYAQRMCEIEGSMKNFLGHRKFFNSTYKNNDLREQDIQDCLKLIGYPLTIMHHAVYVYGDLKHSVNLRERVFYDRLLRES